VIKALKNRLLAHITKDYPLRRYPLSDFDRILHELKLCDVLLIEGNSIVSHIIQNLTKSSWSHAAIYIGRLHDIADHELRKKIQAQYHFDDDIPLIVEGLMEHGIVISPFEKYRNFHIRICRPNGINYPESQVIIDYCINAVGRPYDLRNIFDLFRFLLPWKLFPRKWGSVLFRENEKSDKSICSSLIAEAFEKVNFPILPEIRTDKKTGVTLIRRNPKLFWPSHFDYSPYFQIVKYPMVNIADHPIYKDFPWEDHDEPPSTTSQAI
jgi:hypothetical protein